MQLKKNKLFFLDGLRGLAAFYVMVGHTRWLLWEGYIEGYSKHPLTYNIIDKFLMYFFGIFKYGHEFVLFFFVLSGFVIHLKYAENLKTDGISKLKFTDYFLKRAKRIFPPFIFALFLTCVLDFTGSALHYAIYRGATPYKSINANFGHVNHQGITFLGNLFFLYDVYTPVFGTNGPAWSLKYEWWFYILYPIFILKAKKSIWVPTLAIVFLFILSKLNISWPEQLSRQIFSGMLSWWLGVLLAEIYTQRIKIDFRIVAGLSLVIALILKLSHLRGLEDLTTAFVFAALLSIFLYAAQKESKWLSPFGAFKPLGDMSYTLYIIHVPILAFFSGWLLKHNNGVLPQHSYFIVAGILILLPIAHFCSFITEKLPSRVKTKTIKS